TYERVEVNGEYRISREEAIFEITSDQGNTWWGPKPQKVKTLLEPTLLPRGIDTIPIYWFPNKEWESQHFGSSELRGLEFLDWAISQGSTDVQTALALEGLGVYATDGGRPVDDEGNEEDWEVS